MFVQHEGPIFSRMWTVRNLQDGEKLTATKKKLQQSPHVYLRPSLLSCNNTTESPLGRPGPSSPH